MKYLIILTSLFIMSCGQTNDIFCQRDDFYCEDNKVKYCDIDDGEKVFQDCDKVELTCGSECYGYNTVCCN